MCIGINLCSIKSCIEQENCLFPEKKAKKKAKVNRCQINNKFCINSRACEIFGQCMLEHPSVKANKQFKRQLLKSIDINGILRVFERFMPERKPKKRHRKVILKNQIIRPSNFL
jgi:hypothetical protein